MHLNEEKSIESILIIEEKDETSSVKQTNWNSIANHQNRGLPPNGKRFENEKISPTVKSQRNPRRVSFVRPISFNERFDRIFLENSSKNRQKPISPEENPSLEIVEKENVEFGRSRRRENHFEQSEKQLPIPSSSPIRGCLKRRTASEQRVKKTVHFDADFSNANRLTRTFSTSEMNENEKNRFDRTARLEKKVNVNQATSNTTYLQRPIIGTGRINFNDTNQHEPQREHSIDEEISKKSFFSSIDNQQKPIYHSDSSIGRSINRSSISMSTNSALITIQPDQNDFNPPTKRVVQTSTLIISPPTQYHYFLYPATKTNQTRSTSTMNSISTNSTTSSSSSSSSPSESSFQELDDETFSSSTYSILNSKPKNVKPMVLSDSVQAFWFPSTSKFVARVDKNVDQSSIESRLNSVNGDSASISKNNQIDGRRTPPSSLILNEISTYSEQNSDVSPSKIRQAVYEETQTSYRELLREKSRLINQQRAMSSRSHVCRSKSREPFDSSSSNSQKTFFHRPSSVSSPRTVSTFFASVRNDPSDDFQSKRNFFENRTQSKPNKIYQILPNSANNLINLKKSSNDVSSRQESFSSSSKQQTDSEIRTATKHVDPLKTSVYFNKKPIRLVKAIQRSNESNSPTMNDLIHSKNRRSTIDYLKDLFAQPDPLRRQNPIKNFLSSIGQDEKEKQIDSIQQSQQILNEETEINQVLGRKLLEKIEKNGQRSEFDKFQLHLNEIDMITSVLVKLAGRLARIDNEISQISPTDDEKKKHLVEQRAKIQQKYDEAKFLKEGIDRRARFLSSMLEKYFSKDDFDDYEYFIRMKSTIVLEKKQIEEQLVFLEKEFSSSTPKSSTMNHFQTVVTSA